MRKAFKFLTSRFFMLSFVLVTELALIIAFAVLFSISNYGYYFLIGAWLLNIPAMIFIVNSKANTSYKLGWLLVVGLLPVAGLLFYMLYANKRDTKRQRNKVKPYTEALKKYNRPAIDTLLEVKKDDETAYLHTNYIYNKNFAKPYSNTYTKYFKIGQDAWPVLLDELKKAKHFIFIEYFIIENGKFWNSILEILKEKVQEGVEVRVIYDDFGSMTKVGFNYYKKLRKLGINAVLFQRYRWYLDVKMNNRDHRKIIVIDGHTSFTGGLNLADEYVNEKVRFGEWKDNMVMLKGEGTYGMTILFLSLWDNYLKVQDDFSKYSFKKYQHEMLLTDDPKGYVQPYGDIPFDYESVGANVYINMISRAKKSVYISTPYLILDDTFMNTLILAARSGVDVKIILPGIPDKKTVYALSNAYAYELSKYGVGIYYYKRGFNHMKTMLVDDSYATIGTINLDLRSFHLNYENAVYISNGNCIEDIKNDFDEMFENCKKIKDPKKRKISFFTRVWWAILKCLSPMF